MWNRYKLEDGLTPQQRSYQRVRWECFVRYGGDPPKCACCGEGIHEFFCIDHINGDGSKHRKQVGADSIYWWLRINKFPPGFRVLCCNCNSSFGKYGYCPHQTGSVKPVIVLPVSQRVRAHILETAIRLFKKQVMPSVPAVARASGHHDKVVCKHRKILVEEGRWPGIDLLKTYKTRKGRRLMVTVRKFETIRTRGRDRHIPGAPKYAKQRISIREEL